MENKKQLGGKRKGAGRKPVLSKKKQISLYVEGVKILMFGSEEKLKDKLYSFINGEIIEYKEPAPNAYDGKKMDRITHNEPSQWETPKSPITGLPPKLSLFDDFMAELNNATTIQQVENIMNRAKGEVFTPRNKIALEAHAKEVSKDMFSD